ncbi:MAG TPA: YkvA family protein [Bacilli bacterium]|nr:YkvA family protein [Bacilli bacterium]
MREKPSFWQNVKGMFQDRGTPVRDKLLIVGGAVYILSPIDLIPDFLPILGYTDDFACLIGTVVLFRKSYNSYVKRNRVVFEQKPPHDWR